MTDQTRMDRETVEIKWCWFPIWVVLLWIAVSIARVADTLDYIGAIK